MERVCQRIPGVRLQDYLFTHLEYADDTALFAAKLQDMCEALTVHLQKVKSMSQIMLAHPQVSAIVRLAVCNGKCIGKVVDFTHYW